MKTFKTFIESADAAAERRAKLEAERIRAHQESDARRNRSKSFAQKVKKKVASSLQNLNNFSALAKKKQIEIKRRRMENSKGTNN